MANIFNELASDSLLAIDTKQVQNFVLLWQGVAKMYVDYVIEVTTKVDDERARRAALELFGELSFSKTSDLTVEGSTNIIRQNVTDIAAQVKFNFIAAAFRAYRGEQVQTFGRSVYRTVLQGGINLSRLADIIHQLASEGDVDGLVKLSQAVSQVEFRLPAPPPLPSS